METMSLWDKYHNDNPLVLRAQAKDLRYRASLLIKKAQEMETYLAAIDAAVALEEAKRSRKESR
jgi:hypothetical protein